MDLSSRSAALRDYLAERFVVLFATVKRTEPMRVFKVVAPMNHDWRLRNA